MRTGRKIGVKQAAGTDGVTRPPPPTPTHRGSDWSASYSRRCMLWVEFDVMASVCRVLASCVAGFMQDYVSPFVAGMYRLRQRACRMQGVR